MTPVRLEPATTWFRVRHSTTEPLCFLCHEWLGCLYSSNYDPNDAADGGNSYNGNGEYSNGDENGDNGDTGRR